MLSAAVTATAAAAGSADAVAAAVDCVLAHRGGVPESRAATKFLNGLARAQGLHTTLAALGALQACCLEANAFHFGAVVSACGRDKQWPSALELLRIMEVGRIARDAVLCSGTISACCAAGGRWQLLHTLLRAMAADAVAMDTVAFNAAITACEKGGQWAAALALLCAMSATRIEPDTITHNAVISACEKCGVWSFALSLCASMLHQSIHQDTITYNAVISACENAAKWRVPFSLLDDMGQQRVHSDRISYSATSSACEKAGQWSWPLNMLTVMEEEKIEPEVITYTAIISGAEKAGHWRVSLESLFAMRMDGIPGDTIAGSAAVGAFAKGRQWTFAIRQLGSMRKERSAVAAACGAAISACETSAEWTIACVVLRSMREERANETTIACSAAVSACGRSGQWASALNILRTMTRLRIDPDTLTYNAAASACQRCRRWQLVLQLLTAMQAYELEADDVTCGTAVDALANARQQDLGMSMLLAWQDRGVAQSPCSLVWAFAKLSVRDAEILRAATQGMKFELQGSHPTPQVLSTFAWTSAALSLHDLNLAHEVAVRSLEQVEGFTLRELSILAWAFATQEIQHLELFRAIAGALAHVLCDLGPGDIGHVCLAIWALTFEGCLAAGLRALARAAVLAALHAAAPAAEEQGLPVMLAASPGPHGPCGPRIVLDLPDRFLVLKPPSWQVNVGEDEVAGLPLAAYVQSFLGRRRFPLARDAARQLGFLHRLDVPSSGVVLAAKTRGAYYDLKLLLSAGELERDYAVVCRGTQSTTRMGVSARVHPSDGMVCHEGRPSRTRLKLRGVLCAAARPPAFRPEGSSTQAGGSSA